MNSGSVNPVLDLQSKVRDDPLLAMQHAEKSSLKSILDNPVRMKKLQAVSWPLLFVLRNVLNVASLSSPLLPPL